MSKTEVALIRFAKVVGAAAVAVAIQHIPDLGAVIPYGVYGVGIATAILSAIEKALTHTPTTP